MTADEIVLRLAQVTRRAKTLRDDNQRLWDSREEWKAKHREREAEIVALRRQVKRSRESRDRWRTLARKRGEKLYNYRRNGAAPWHNIQLSERDLERILEMPPR